MSDHHTSPHDDHMAWQTEHEQWKRELDAWLGELPDLLARTKGWLDAQLEGHARDIQQHEDAIDRHEAQLAVDDRAGAPHIHSTGAHDRGGEGHRATRGRHAKLAAIIGKLRDLVDEIDRAQ